MKLDSIIYDYNTLQEAIATTLNEESPSFKAIYPSDTATSLTQVLGSYGSMLQYQLVSAMANMYTDSAYSEAGIRQLAETLGNRLHGNVSSEVYVNIERLNLKGINGIIIPKGSKFVTSDLNFFNPDPILFPSDNIRYNIKLIQGELLTSEFVTSGISGEKIYFCDEFKCNMNLVKVYINDEQWDTSDTFLPYVITDVNAETQTNVVVLRTDADGRTYIKFGNGSNGKIPTKGTTVKIEYVTNDGASGNLNNKDLTLSLITPIYYSESPSTQTQLEVEITATTTASGGFNTQSLEVLKESSPYVFASGQRAVRREDYKSMFLNQCGYLTANVWGEYEEAAINGGYDKIMMNMVYYSGIKSIQKYDLFPINENLDFNLNDLQFLDADFYPIDGSIKNANGFLGSYEFVIKSYDSENKEISIKYNDAQGTGIITCNPSSNFNLIHENYPSQESFENEVFPINDLSDFLSETHHSITTNQTESTESETEEKDKKLITGGYGISSGMYNGQPRLITFDNPFQIRLNFDKENLSDERREAIAAFAFKMPADVNNLKYFPYKLAIFATNTAITPSNEDIMYNNIKNNSNWIKLTGVKTFDNVSVGVYSDWITTSVYSPNSSETKEETFSSESVLSQEGENTKLKITKLSVNFGYEYSVRINGITQSRNTYTIQTEDLDDGKTDTLTFNRVLTEDELSSTILYGTINDWTSYRNYVIEVYQTQSGENSITQVAMDQIKAIYKKSSSQIDYNTNDLRLNLPITTETQEQIQLKKLALPESMQYYEYSIALTGVNVANGYKTNDTLSCVISTAIGDYSFLIDITSITNVESGKGYTVKLKKPEDKSYSSVLRGKVNIQSQDMSITGGSGTGGTITITSNNTVSLTTNYTGNYYTNSDIQAFDLPIINKYNHFTTYLEFKQPHVRNINIEINVEYDNISTYQVTRNLIIDAINKLFEIKPNSIGATCNVSDIWKAVNSVPNIKRFNVLTPKNDITCMPYELLSLPAENLIINDIINSEYK